MQILITCNHTYFLKNSFTFNTVEYQIIIYYQC